MPSDSEAPASGRPDPETVRRDSGEELILRRQLETQPANAGYFAIFRYATSWDVAAILVSAVACGAAGTGQPVMMVFVGSMTGSFSDLAAGSTASDEFIQAIENTALKFVYVAVAQFVILAVGIHGLNHIGERVTKKLRQAYLAAVLRQNVAFFDGVGAGEIAIRISNDMSLVQDGISQKVGLIAYGVVGFFSSIIIGLVTYWQLALVMLGAPVALILCSAVLGNIMKRAQEAASDEYIKSSTFAEEVVSSFRNVIAYGSQGRFLAQYDAMLAPARDYDIKAGLTFGLLFASILGLLYAGYGLGFWQGHRFLQQGIGNVGDTITVLFISTIAGVLLSNAVRFTASLGQAGISASRIFATIERQSPLDPLSTDGRRLASLEGTIEFQGLRMVYPSRQDQLILEDFSLTVPAGKTVAIVGPSGSGKTTIFAMLERLYLPLGGTITLDGHQIDHLNIGWLRSQIGLVSQDNFLFNTSIFNNIAYGLGAEYGKLDDEATMRLVQEAAKIANAHSFIEEYPEGYHANVGERGSRLSGGQRQRVAIARAIVGNPKILLLDEATSALDPHNERVVQDALASATNGRTTIIIAHRLSTVQSADLIAVMQSGRVVEKGTHDSLLAAGSTYASLVQAQALRQGEAGEGEPEDSTDLPLHKESTVVSAPSVAGAENQPGSKKHAENGSVSQLARLVWTINAPERLYLVFGILCALLAGPVVPVCGVILGNAVVSLTNPELSSGGLPMGFWAGMFLLLALVMLLAQGMQGYLLAVAGASLGSRARSRAFASILRQDAAFFDRQENSSGALTVLLSTEATRLMGISGNTLGSISNNIVTIVTAIAIACGFGWKLGLVATATMPLIMACGYLRTWAVVKIEQRLKQATASAGIAAEAVSAIRTVATLAMEETVKRQYAESLESDQAANLFHDFIGAVPYALSQSLILLVNALLFWYAGTRLLLTGEYTLQQFFICYSSVLFSAQIASALFAMSPDIAGALDAAAHLKYLLESKPSIEVEPEEESDEDKTFHNLVGDVALEAVRFAYPSRPKHHVIKDVDLVTRHGQFIALVGGSGSGKSTVLNLIERFYDASSGAVKIDGQDIRELNLKRFRCHVALVEQEGALIGGTIRDSLISDDESVSDKSLKEACQAANIYDFVVSLPDGFNTLTGARGNRVSGGQRQRLAIAKALLRDPKILLLDEATSALDSTSEKLVQNALDTASRGRTTIAVAHRLSSIANADCIFVFDHGRIVESGSHDELVKKRGRYFELATLQQLSQ
ncbi:multidrug resistance protein-like protein 1 [Lasiosphaeria miniovina]|uniref:Multidrug resistance protein-like protein 1 n=1 Tax=Lasiosphaeria miniovina TaxID=1954250 RepID=A0AA40AWS5_9PEZI|nr:multidrug resistance protein-like protein 1 [Lasiosphaeria miniovina]KAK0723446.1 multidrug resistance protein-like protein 1 [Lasiosphaeria miniovina]